MSQSKCSEFICSMQSANENSNVVGCGGGYDKDGKWTCDRNKNIDNINKLNNRAIKIKKILNNE